LLPGSIQATDFMGYVLQAMAVNKIAWSSFRIRRAHSRGDAEAHGTAPTTPEACGSIAQRARRG
jgi:hypothetical protein